MPPGRPRASDRFDDGALRVLERAAADLSFLLERGYSMRASLKLVGDRFQLRRPQRQALLRALSLYPTAQRRRQRRLPAANMRGCPVAIDGYNVLITVESALRGDVLIRCADGCLRDIRGVGARYRVTKTTDQALSLLGDFLLENGATEAEWVFDAPISGSGELAGRLRTTSEQRGWPFDGKTADSADGKLAQSERIVCSGDAALLDRARWWVDLAGELIASQMPAVRILSFVSPDPS